MFRSLRGRLVVTYVILIFSAMLVMGVFLLNTLEQYYVTNVKDSLRKEAELVGAILPEGGLSYTSNSQLNRFSQLWASKLGTRVTIIDLEGTVLSDSHEHPSAMENHRQREEVAAALEGGYGESNRFSESIRTQMMYVAIPIVDEGGDVVGVVRLAMSLQDIQNDHSRLWSIVTSGIVLSSLVAVLVGIKLSSSIIRPVQEMTELAHKISQGDFEPSTPIQTKDELGQLGRSLHTMANNLKEKVTELSDEKSKFEAVLTNIISGVALVDSQNRLVLGNPAFFYIFGIDSPEIINRSLTAVTHNYQLGNWVEEVQEQGKGMKQEITLYYPTEKVVEVNLIPMGLQQKDLSGVLLVFYDLTEIRRLEGVRQDFVANVSHELRTPLTAIKGLSETLLDGALDDGEVSKDFVAMILKESERLNRLVSDLLGLARIEAGKHEGKRDCFDLREVALQTTREMAYQFDGLGVELITEFPSGPLLFYGNEDQLKQVFLNLLENGAKYSKGKGTVKFVLRDEPQQVVISIKDQGIGIPPEDIPRIFERFYRVDKARSRKQGGTGLGLAIVKHIVETHEGTIQVQSKLGEGSCFIITLPKYETC